MSRLVNQNWIGLDGEPVTGRVPTRLLVYGPPLTREQYGAVAHLYKLFTDASRVAIGQYQVRERKLADGSRVRCTSFNGSDTVQVWTAGGGRLYKVYRGLAYIPRAVDGFGEGVTYGHPWDANDGYGTQYPGDYTSSPDKAVTTTRIVKKTEQGWKDAVRGLHEGTYNTRGLPQQYWVRYEDRDGVLIDTDEVWTAAGLGYVFCNNRLVARNSLFAEGIAYPFHDKLIHIDYLGAIRYIKPLSMALDLPKKASAVTVAFGDPFVSYSATMPTLPVRIYKPTTFESFRGASHISLDGSKVCVFNGAGHVAAVQLTYNEQTGAVSASQTYYIAEPEPNDAPLLADIKTTADSPSNYYTNINDYYLGSSTTYAESYSEPERVVMGFFDRIGELKLITHGYDAESVGVFLSEDYATPASGGRVKVYHRRTTTPYYAHEKKVMYADGVELYVAHEYTEHLSADELYTTTTVSFTELFSGEYNNNDVPYVTVTTAGTTEERGYETITHTRNSVFREMYYFDPIHDIKVWKETVSEFSSTVTTPQDVGFNYTKTYKEWRDPPVGNPVLLSESTESFFEPFVQVRSSAATVRNYKAINIWVKGVLRTHVFSDTLGSATPTTDPFVRRYDPVSQNTSMPWFYLHQGAYANMAFRDVGEFQLIGQIADDFGQQSVLFTESGFVDWLAQCGFPEPVAPVNKRATCFRIGGPKMLKEAP